ncbi:serine/threonine-protein kinase MRCK alpha-like isoform X2 [Hemiscyllium ocellatum]|uniref:serine/threonine-protein kinase MRCK alpha-like isoform X2 n=1 Tax=Hemiscyllium ocellatum TaxID=170820 RepID=UPI002966ED93|nr:serine/threonine-protein kinase MRCK alpha-like isoform X2 [Hemiscyllium ocellatum]
MSTEERLRQLEQLMVHTAPRCGESEPRLSVETLLDLLLCLYYELVSSPLRKDPNIAGFLHWVSPFANKLKKMRLQREDFEILKVIGRGAFGEVAVVKLKNSEKVFAMKILHKWEMLKRAETACFREERDILMKGDNQWITTLHYAFQDEQYLYLVMDYYVGGDLLTLLSKFEDRLPEDMARFYIAEMVLAIHSIHQLNYVHRDIKPDNVLIDMNGHIRLADFGSCLQLGPDGTVETSVAVGTPDYISPEILQAMEDGKGKYGPECDWWSLGVCMYELLFGETPFYAESLVETYGKIMNHKDKLSFPPDISDVSEEAQDLIAKLVCGKDRRLGQAGIRDLQGHPFFAGIDWQRIRECPPPYIPEVTSPTDTSNFDVDDDVLKLADSTVPSSRGAFSGLHLPFVGFTYTSNCSLSDRGCLRDAWGSTSLDNREAEAFEIQIKQLEMDKRELNHRLQESLQKAAVGHSSSGTAKKEMEIKSLKEEMQILKTRLAENQLDNDEQVKRKSESENHQLRTLEKQLKTLKQEKEEIYKDLAESREQLGVQSRELREAQVKRQRAEEEMQEGEERYSQLRLQKQKLSRDLRDREEEMEVVMEKVESLRQQLSTADRCRLVLEAKMEEQAQEVAEESQLRERSEQRRRQLEEELERLKLAQTGADPSSRGPDPRRELAEVQGRALACEEELARQHSAQAAELKAAREQLEESESRQQRLERELVASRDRLEKARSERQSEQEELVMELRAAHEQEKNQLREENLRLNVELEPLLEKLEKLQARNKRLEEELQALEGRKETVKQWDTQIAEIIQWVSEEKEARGYLQSLATKMAEELDSLKSTSSNAKPVDTHWKVRRLQKLEASAKLELQSALDAEIRAKQSLQEQLNEAKLTNLATECKLQELEKQSESLKQEVEKLKEEAQTKVQKGLRQDSVFSFLSPLSFESFDFTATSRLSPDSRKSPGSPVPQPESPSFRSREVPISNVKPVSPRKVLKKPTSPPPVAPQAPKPTPHRFKLKTFQVPTKCMRCTSLMVGLIRQGLSCEVCHFVCHSTCSAEAIICPTPPEQIRSLGIDPVKGTGTAFEGSVSVPKPTGVRKGWHRAHAILCDFKIFVYEVAESRSAQASAAVTHVFNLRDEEFSVSSVFFSDVIHANKNDVPCIFRITAPQLTVPSSKASLLVLADSEKEKKKWVTVINELVAICKQNGFKEQSAVCLKEAYDSALPLIRNTLAAAIIEITLLGDCKRVHQLELVPSARLLAVVSGRSRNVRVFTWEDLQNPEATGAKLLEARGSQLITTGSRCQGKSTNWLCTAAKRHVTCYQLTTGKQPFRRTREFQAPGTVQWMGVFEECLCVGYPSGFSLYSLAGEGPPANLVSPEDPSLTFLSQGQAEALCAVTVSSDLYLLCFNTVGVYVNGQGQRSEQRELMWPALPVAVACHGPYLTVYSENAMNIFEVKTGEWIQTIPLKKVRPLNSNGSLNLSASEPFRLIYLRRKEAGTDDFVIPEKTGNIRRQMHRTKSKRRFAFRISEEDRFQQLREMLKDPQRRSNLISGPTNFNHLVHVGPSQGMHNLRDLPSSKDSLEERNQMSSVLPTFRHRSNTESGFLSDKKTSKDPAPGSSSSQLPRKQISSDSTSLADFNPTRL